MSVWQSLSCEIKAQNFAWTIGILSILVASGATAAEPVNVSDLPATAKTVKEWVAQVEVATAQVIAIRVVTVENRLQVQIETADGRTLQATTREEGNTLIAEINNAVLALPDGGAFRAEKPAIDIQEVTATQVNASTVQIRIVGDAIAPVAEIVKSDPSELRGANRGLVLSVEPAEDAVDEEEITVTGEGQERYRVPNASTATRTDTPIRDIPQSIQVVPRQVIEDRQPTNLVDALRSVPGISTQGQPSTSVYEEPVIRGFTVSEFDVVRNGLSSPYGVLSFDSATIERIEVLRGPASVLFGQGSLGGVINVITKQPLSESQYSIEVTAGNFSRYGGAIDLTGPLTEDKKVLYRLNFTGKNTGSFLDFFDRRQFTVAPSLAWQIGSNTTLKLSGEYTNSSGSFGQVGLPARGTVLPNLNGKIPIDRNLSEPFANDNTESYRIGYNLEHQLSDNWQFRSIFEVAWFNQDREIVTVIGLEPDDRTALRRYLEGSLEARNLTLDNYVVGNFATGRIQHRLVAGLTYARTEQSASEAAESRIAAAPIDIFAPVYGQPFGERLDVPFEGEATSNAYGFYLQCDSLKREK